MATNFLETVKNYFTSEFSIMASNSLDESSAGISRAINAIIPVGLAGILRKANSGEEGANRIYDLSKDAVSYLSPIPNLTDLHNEEKGSDLPSAIFGNEESKIDGSIAQYAGIKKSSASSLITLAIPDILGLLGKHAVENNLSASGLAGFLSAQKDQVRQAIPPGLTSVAEMLGLGGLGTAVPSTATELNSLDGGDAIPQRKKNIKWIPIITILAVILLLIYFSRGCE